MNKTMILAALAAALALPVVAMAGHNADPVCQQAALGLTQLGNNPPNVFYIDHRSSPQVLLVYQETNTVFTAGAPAHENLQRGPPSSAIRTDLCNDFSLQGADKLVL